ncbi:DHA2 family efflux MFS transporter permease subunit [Nocardia sp. SYP-A9097]|uniref:MFS transporter n=1 Tax=Nocardia sp. SYP-A9097 TaxID=2663237 RepID=UPI00129A4CD3|nr:MFS transporter [Nocardia sp. SYP-A9097]MRH92356.1 DHA2 family efflux MFS transporter permease subunit [Nocardia sp. SYP-A9097]
MSTTFGSPAPAGTQHSSTSARWWTLAAVSLSVFMLLLDLTVVNVALPPIQHDLRADFSEMQWVIDAYALALAALLLTAGSIADRIGRRRVFAAGLVWFTVASLLCGLAQGVLLLNLARGAQGIGAAVLYAVGPALIARDFVGRERGTAFGVFGAVSGLAIACGPLLGGVLTELSWRWVFLINVPVGLVGLIIIVTRVAESRLDHARPIDLPGVFTISGAMFALILAVLRGERDGWTSTRSIVTFLVAAALTVAFVLVERRAEHPMLDLKLFRNNTFRGLSAATFCFNFAVNAIILYVVLWLEGSLGMSAIATGLRFLPLTVVLFAAGAIGGVLSARVPIRVLMGGALLFAGVGFLLMLLVDVNSTWAVLLPGMVVAGIGMGAHNPPRANAAVALVPPEDAGMGAGVNESFQQGGVALGVAVLGAVAHHRIDAVFHTRLTESGNDTAYGHLAEQVAAGAGRDITTAVPDPARTAVADAAQHAFLSGFHLVAGLGGIITLLGAAIAFATIRRRDFVVDPAAPAFDDTLDSAAPRSDGAELPDEPNELISIDRRLR